MASIRRGSTGDRVVPDPRARSVLGSSLALLFLVACAHRAPGLQRSAYGVSVVSDLATYRALIAEDPDRALADLARFLPNARLDIRYATPNNFMKQPLYPEPRAFLRCAAARALAGAQAELGTRGLGLKIFDAYRPYSVTVAMWERIRNPDYVADPAKGSRHNRGAAVDVTLVDLATGAELPMPTGYDDFTERAAQSFMDLPEEPVRNRTLLRDVMERHGFLALPSEWWHFDFRGWEKFELLDLTHAELQRDTLAACPAVIVR